jgi:YVTN family beta-propeller protein
MNAKDEAIKSALRTALHDAAGQIDVRSATLMTADELVVHRRVTRRAPMVAAMAACLAVALVVGGWLLVSGGNDPPSVLTPAAGVVGGCAGKAYVTNGSGSVSVIDTATGKVSAPIPVGGSLGGVAFTPDGRHAYVTRSKIADDNSPDGTVSVIDTATGVVSATIDVAAPTGIAITPDGTHAYVTNNDGNQRSGWVSVIDTATGKVSAPIPVGGSPHGGYPSGVAITPDGTHAYVTYFAGTNGDGLAVIDTATGVVSARIDLGKLSVAPGLAFSPDGTHAYVANVVGEPVSPGTVTVVIDTVVSVIDTATGKVSARIDAGRGSRGIYGGGGIGGAAIAVASTPDGTLAYVTSSFSDTVSVIDTATGVVSAHIPVGGFPVFPGSSGAVAFTSDGRHAYVTVGDDNTVAVIDTATGVVSATIPVGEHPTGVAICPAISVAQARRVTVQGPVLVNGYLVVTANGQVRICAGLRATRPPRCTTSALTVRGLVRRDFDDLALRGRPGRTRWRPDPVQILGAVQGDVLRVAENAPA